MTVCVFRTTIALNDGCSETETQRVSQHNLIFYAQQQRQLNMLMVTRERQTEETDNISFQYQEHLKLISRGSIYSTQYLICNCIFLFFSTHGGGETGK